ncbi:MAG: heat-inducible transcriptional repressor HrcA, partial [Proteobacteria bacterium]|nr:heat-inducible transcriptional repressor HrcA [Pseudomonadota bacterium]
RSLFAALETKEMMLRVLSLADTAEGVRIYIGADNRLFNLAGVSMIVGPYNDSRQQIVGAIGVIGPTRMNYARIIPLVDYTAQMIARRIG